MKIGKHHSLQVHDGKLFLIKYKQVPPLIIPTLIIATITYKNFFPLWVGLTLIFIVWLSILFRVVVIIDCKKDFLRKSILFLNWEVYKFYESSELSTGRVVSSKKTEPGDDLAVGPTLFYVELIENSGKHVLLTKFRSAKEVEKLQNCIQQQTSLDFQML